MRPKTDPWGIDAGYEDCDGRWCATPPETRAAILKAIGAADEPPKAHVIVVRPGERKAMPEPGVLTLEDGATLRVNRYLPKIPFGYHRFQPDSGSDYWSIIASPGKCPRGEDMKDWGWAAQLYAVRSRASWGIGDLADLRRLAGWSVSLGARFLLINPLFAATPIKPQEPSPYYPASRRFRNPIYLRIEEVPGARDHSAQIERFAVAGRALNSSSRIARDCVWDSKIAALEYLWAHFSGDPGFDAYCREQGTALAQFATFCALAETQNRGWHGWPEEFRHPDSPSVRNFAAERHGRVRFHQWLQWLLDRQLAAASKFVALLQDLPVGVDPNGADAWAWQDLLASGMSFGAPPDPYSAMGQDWGLPPFIPHRLRTARYEPFVQTIRSALCHSGGLRIDHVMGLFRLFWIPAGATPVEGAYVRYPADDLLGIIALESHRAGAFVVGEDLGTVEAGVREQLIAHNILSSRLVWFEDDPPESYPARTFAAITTHDLPTVAGVWTGSDPRVQPVMRERLMKLAEIDHGTKHEVILRAYRALAAAPSAAISATLDDAVGAEERPNMPGTTTEWPNWSIPLPKDLEEIEADPLALSVADALKRDPR